MSNLGNPFQFRDNWYALAPPWLEEGDVELYMYTLQLCTDLLLEKAYEAMTIRLPGLGDASQIPYLAFDRQLTQGPNESNAAFVTRLRDAFEAWAIAGSRVAVLQQLGYYLQGCQPGVAPGLPMMTIAGGCYPNVTTWDTVRIGDAPGSVPVRTTKVPSNFNWDGKSKAWRTWLVLFMSPVASGQSGTAAQLASAAPSACYTSPGKLASFTSPSTGIVYGQCWVPATSGTPVNSPWVTVTGLSGLTPRSAWITLSGSTASAQNNGLFPIVQVLSDSSCVIAMPNASVVVPDTGPLTWSVSAYPFLAPGPVWGSPGVVFGQGELQTPALDYGSTLQGVWQPTLSSASYPTLAWGLTAPTGQVPTQTLETIRGLVRQWKSAGTFYESIVVAFDGGTGVATSAYSPLSAAGFGNPGGNFGGHGVLASGVWYPNRSISSTFDAYCQGTGTWRGCSVPNVT